MRPDWGAGNYEPTAEGLAPAAEQLVRSAGLRPGEQVLDVGCGTGNAALLAARAGAHVTGVEPAPRLLGVAAAAAAAAGLTLDLRPGGAPGLPIDDASQDVVLSNFAVIFTPDPAAAATDLVRVLRPSGRIALTAWLPGGAIDRAIGAAMRAVAEVAQAAGRPGPPQPSFAWHDRAALGAALAGAGRPLTVTTEEHDLAFTSRSAEVYLDEVLAVHPMSLMAADALRASGGDPARLREALLAELVKGNEDPAGFRVTSRYVVHLAR